MVAYRRDEIISATDLARNISATLNSITQKNKEKIAISKNNKLEAVIIDIEEYEKLKEAYEILEHLNIGNIINQRKDSSTISFEELLEKEGIDINDL